MEAHCSRFFSIILLLLVNLITGQVADGVLPTGTFILTDLQVNLIDEIRQTHALQIEDHQGNVVSFEVEPSEFYSADASVNIYDDTQGSLTQLTPQSSSFKATRNHMNKYDNSSFVTITKMDDGSIHGVYYHDGHLIQIAPISHFSDKFDDVHHLRRLTDDGVHVGFNIDDAVEWLGGAKACGDDEHEMPHMDDDNDDENIDNNKRTLESKQFNSQLHHDVVRMLDNVVPFTPNCYDGDDVTREFKIGIAMDVGFFKKHDSNVKKAIQSMESIVAVARHLFYVSFNILLVVDQIELHKTSDIAPFNGDPEAGTCFVDIFKNYWPIKTGPQQTLDALTLWHQSLPAESTDNQPRRQGHWHLLTDCHPLPGIVGLSWIGRLCEPFSSAITSFNYMTWLIFMHEVGHSFNMRHIKNPGIMNLAQPKVNDVFQFNAEDQRHSVCAMLQNSLPYCDKLGITTVRVTQAVCGNGVLDVGEQCECTAVDATSCGQCQQCKLVGPGASSIQCSTTEFAVAYGKMLPTAVTTEDVSCCNSHSFMQFGTTCGSDNGGICTDKGQCINTCQATDLLSCGTVNHDCRQLCKKSEGAKCGAYYLGQIVKSFDNYLGNMPNDIPCNNNQGVCFNGECVASVGGVPSAFATQTSEPTPQPTSQPTRQPINVEAVPEKTDCATLSKKQCKARANRKACKWSRRKPKKTCIDRPYKKPSKKNLR